MKFATDIEKVNMKICHWLIEERDIEFTEMSKSDSSAGSESIAF